MAKHPVTPFVPPPIDDERFSRNGMVPDAALMKRLAGDFKYISGRAKQQVFLRCQPINNVAAGVALSADVWPFYFRTGENTTGLRVVLGAAATDYTIAGTTAYLQFTVNVAGGSEVIEKVWSLTVGASGVDVTPNGIAVIHELCTGLSPNTEYTARFDLLAGYRLVFAAITEADTRHADDSVTAVCDPAEFVAEGPIYDAHLADLIEANNELWQHNGAHLINWCADLHEDAAPTTNLTTYTNILDASSTTVTASSPGWNLFTQYHNTANRTTVPVKFAVKTSRTAGAGTLDVRLTDGTNSIAITGIGGGEIWSTTTANIPAQAGTKWDLQCRVSVGTDTHRIMAIALFEYEA
jgi:hypothetical protein